MTTGKDLIRRALSARNKKINICAIAKDIGVASPALEAFA